ncbi:MAG: chromosomal replication initiator protein DnaA [Bacteroidia bacterium]|nr:chromosomal replication initiator protein DnaA [Bacteroidia bacterium]
MAKNHEEVWKNCLTIIRDNVPSISYRTWFEPIVPLKIQNNVLTIQVPSPFFYEFLEEQYIDIISKTLRKEIGAEAKLEYNVVMENTVNSNSRPYTVKLPAKNKTELVNKPVNLPFKPDEEGIKNPFVIPGIRKMQIDPQLNPDNTFRNFVEGECNKLARSASVTVAANPGGTAFNPIFIYGGSGLGKTHLAQAIGIEVKETLPDKTVLYVTANKFKTQYIESIRNNTSNDFIHFYQMIDVLIIDDVQEFAGKEKTQETFFQIFNHLHQLKKQLILTADKPPVELEGMEQRLLSRFKWGLCVDLQPPDLDTRIAILKQKIYNDGLVLPEEVIHYIASHITNNIRELEGALVSVLAQSTLNRKDITLELTRELISKLIKNTKKEISIDYIQKIVCDFFNLSLEQLQSKTRKREIVQARQIAMYFSKNYTKSSLATIGTQIGVKDHATVLHACRTVNNLLETDRQFRQDVEEIEKKLKN